MCRKLLQRSFVGIACAMLCTSSFAIMSVPYGWYLEGNVGYSRLSNQSFRGFSQNSNGYGANINLGYKFMPFFALEAGYTQYANTKIRGPNRMTAATIKFYSYDVAAKAIVPIEDSGMELFAKVGAGRGNASISITNTTANASLGIVKGSRSSTGLFAGIGAQYYFTPSFAVVAQWARVVGNSTRVGTHDVLSIGINAIFI